MKEKMSKPMKIYWIVIITIFFAEMVYWQRKPIRKCVNSIRSDSWQDVGIRVYNAGDFAEAENLFDKAYTLKPNAESAYYRMECLLKQKGFAHGSPEAVKLLGKKLYTCSFRNEIGALIIILNYYDNCVPGVDNFVEFQRVTDDMIYNWLVRKEVYQQFAERMDIENIVPGSNLIGLVQIYAGGPATSWPPVFLFSYMCQLNGI